MDDNVDTNKLRNPALSPWMSKEEISFVESFINKDSYMLEYGCGGSTLHFPDYVKGYCSIESDEEWFKKIKEHPDNNAAMVLIPPKAHEDVIRVAEKQERDSPDYSWDNLQNSIFYKIFEDYTEAHRAFVVDRFDAILIDGRARQHCARAIYDVIDKDAVVFIHDFFPRKTYHLVLEKYKMIGQVLSGQSIVALQKI